MVIGMSYLDDDRFRREAEEIKSEGWMATAARWPCPWIWHELDGPWWGV